MEPSRRFSTSTATLVLDLKKDNTVAATRIRTAGLLETPPRNQTRKGGDGDGGGGVDYILKNNTNNCFLLTALFVWLA